MKKIIEEPGGDGLVTLLGQNVILICASYFYAGKLVGVDEQDVLLESAVLVYETGEWSAKTWKDAQPLPGGVWYVKIASIESYGISGR